MKPPVAHFVEHFLRTCLDTFTTRDFVKHFASMGIRMTDKQALEYILNNPYVYQLEDKSFVTRAGMFTGAYFSIKPTAQEVAQGLFVVGDRCLPFVDEELLPSELIFCADTEELSAKVGVFDSDFAIDVYQLFGEEYAPQYIASDPANAQINFVDRNFELPATVSLTGFDLEPLVRRFNFTEGDRLLCHVIDWDLGMHTMMYLTQAFRQRSVLNGMPFWNSACSTVFRMWDRACLLASSLKWCLLTRGTNCVFPTAARWKNMLCAMQEK